MSLIGELPKFNSATDDWQVYTERLEQFFEINDVPDEKKKAILITSISDEVYKTLRDLCHPQVPKEKSYQELVELLNKQYIQKTSVYRERYTCYNAQQLLDESVYNWFARLKKLSVDCKFGERFEEILLDRFVSGLQSTIILNRLCEEETLTLQQAIDIAVAKESSAQILVESSKECNFTPYEPIVDPQSTPSNARMYTNEECQKNYGQQHFNARDGKYNQFNSMRKRRYNAYAEHNRCSKMSRQNKFY